MRYKYKCPETQRREIMASAKQQVHLMQSKRAIEEELAKTDENKRNKKTLESKLQHIQKGLDALNEQRKGEDRGWILVDFPATFSQAKLLEKALSGYEPEEDLELTERQKMLNDSALLV